MLTVIREPTSNRKDYGRIGFHEEAHALYLLFPRALPREEGRVVGLNYALIDEPSVRDPVEPAAIVARNNRRTAAVPRADHATKKKLSKLAPVEREFTVQIRRTAIIDTKVTVKAASRKRAKEEALKSVKDQPFDIKRGAVRELV